MAPTRGENALLLASLVYFCITHNAECFVPSPSTSCLSGAQRRQHVFSSFHVSSSSLAVGGPSFIDADVNDDDDEDDDDDDDDDVEPDVYMEKAASEFLDSGGSGSTSSSGGSSVSSSGLAPMGATSLDWGGAYGTLRDRVGDIESGRTGPSNALFRLLSTDTPNEAIGKFINEANPEVVGAMSGAVSSLLGGLSNPSSGIEIVVKATGEKLGNLCFQLQMTGYMFRNAEYVLALKEIMKLRGSATLEDYRNAFDKLDSDGSGFIESREVEALLSDVYGDDIPSFEITAFLDFFDANNDGRISWEEFERGLGAVYVQKRRKEDGSINGQRALPGSAGEEDDDEEEDDYPDFEELFGQPTVSGKVEVELKNGKVIEVEAEKYMNSLKEEAEALKMALQREKGGGGPPGTGGAPGGLVPGAPTTGSEVVGIAGYIASLQGDVKSLTEGISPEVVDSMKLLIDFVLEGGTKKNKIEPDKEMEVPGSALQQLALWQLVLGYRLREQEAKGDYRRLLDS